MKIKTIVIEYLIKYFMACGIGAHIFLLWWFLSNLK